MYLIGNCRQGATQEGWQAHRSPSDLRRARPPLPSCEIAAGRGQSAGVHNACEGIATPNRASFLLLLSKWAMGSAHSEGSQVPRLLRGGNVSS